MSAASEFEPRIIGFLCNWCSYAGADRAGTAQKPHPANLSIVRLMCTGRLEPEFVLEAFKDGADGVLVLGCHPGDCHYKTGNIMAAGRIRALLKILPDFGIEPERLRMDYVSAGEGDRFIQIATEMHEALKALGPLKR